MIFKAMCACEGQEEKGGTEQSYDAASVRTESNAKPKFGSGWVNPLESLIEGFTDWQFQPSSPQGAGPAVHLHMQPMA